MDVDKWANIDLGELDDLEDLSGSTAGFSLSSCDELVSTVSCVATLLEPCDARSSMSKFLDVTGQLIDNRGRTPRCDDDVSSVLDVPPKPKRGEDRELPLELCCLLDFVWLWCRRVE